METSGLHFAEPQWLWLLLLLVPVALWRLRVGTSGRRPPVEDYADPELLPLLLRQQRPDRRRQWRGLLYWGTLWLLGVLAMAGPRWGFTERVLFEPDQRLVILLDISRSMLVDDVRPSRLARARQEIDDLLDMAPALPVGLVAFASVAQVVSPITQDHETLRRLLPEVSTGLVKLSGSRLGPALDKAARLLRRVPGEPGSLHILLISDGDFAHEDWRGSIQALRQNGIELHTLGVGTVEGGKVPSPSGGWIMDAQGRPVVSALGEAALRDLANLGGGVYRQAGYGNSDMGAVVERIRRHTGQVATRQRSLRIWNEWFFVPVALMLFGLLPGFRRYRARLRPELGQ